MTEENSSLEMIALNLRASCWLLASRPARITDQQKKVEDGVSSRAGQIEGLLKQPGSSDNWEEHGLDELLDFWKGSFWWIVSGGVLQCFRPWTLQRCMLDRPFSSYHFWEGFISFSFLGAKKATELAAKHHYFEDLNSFRFEGV